MFAALPDHLEFFQERINLFVALAPPTRISHTSAEIFQYLSKHEEILKYIAEEWGLYELFPYDPFGNTMFHNFCKYAKYFCELGIKMIMSTDSKVDNMDRVPVTLGHVPAGNNLNEVAHYG